MNRSRFCHWQSRSIAQGSRSKMTTTVRVLDACGDKNIKVAIALCFAAARDSYSARPGKSQNDELQGNPLVQ
jgi:hypothetical protein